MSRRNRPRHTVTVTIAGEKHVLRSDAAPEYTRAVAEHVDRTVHALGDAQPLQPHRTAILAALFITDELFRTRAELRRLREELEARSAGLSERLERAVHAGRQPAGALEPVAAPEPAPPGADGAAGDAAPTSDAVPAGEAGRPGGAAASDES